MDGDEGNRKPFSVLVIEVAAVLIPLAALAAFCAYLAWGDDAADAGPEATPIIVELPPGSEPVPGGEPTAAGTGGSPRAFVSESAGGATGTGADGTRPGGAAAEVSGGPVEADIAPQPERSPIVWVRHGRTIEILDQPGGAVVAVRGDATSFGSPSVFAVLETTPGWVGVSTPELPNGELGWIRADPALLRGDYIAYSVVVDLSDRRAELFFGGESVRSWPVTIGAPGTETPTGEFGVTDTFRGGLNPVYGCCAVALSATQPNLPSGWVGGKRIAFHGTDGPLGIAGSSGCIRSRDADVDMLVSTLPLGTPVTIEE